MNKQDLAKLLRLLSVGERIGDVWRRAGYTSERSAAGDLERLAGSIPSGDEFEESGPDFTISTGLDKGRGREIIVHSDGAARGNPGPAAAAAVAYDRSGSRIASASELIGRATNNVAEYRSCLLALELAIKLRAKRLTVRMDSELVVKQLRGEYRIRDSKLKKLAAGIFEKAGHFDSCSWEHVPRDSNTDADSLANERLDRAVRPG
jgi:ribonuclease HI